MSCSDYIALPEASGALDDALFLYVRRTEYRQLLREREEYKKERDDYRSLVAHLRSGDSNEWTYVRTEAGTEEYEALQTAAAQVRELEIEISASDRQYEMLAEQFSQLRQQYKELEEKLYVWQQNKTTTQACMAQANPYTVLKKTLM